VPIPPAEGPFVAAMAGRPSPESIPTPDVRPRGRTITWTRVAAPTPGSERVFHWTLAVFATVLALASGWALHLTGISVAPRPLWPRVGVLVVLAAGALFYRWRRMVRLADTILFTFWGILFSNLHCLPMFVAARQQVPLRDALLARWDTALGLQVPAVLAAVAVHPLAGRFLEHCYGTLVPLVAAAIIVPPLVGRLRPAKEYAIGCIVAALIGIPLFGFFQAEGPWIHYGYTPALDQAAYVHTFAALKAPAPFVLDLSYGDGLICFPSFHTILAVLAATALWDVPFLRWPAAILAALIVVSTVTTGTHYVVDVVAGLAVAALAHAAARGYTRLESRQPRV
jgi:membrane-associated phospholipid phosphatase